MEDILPGKGLGYTLRPDPPPGVKPEDGLRLQVMTHGPQGEPRDMTTPPAAPEGELVGLQGEPMEDTSTPQRTVEADLALEEPDMDPAGQALAS